VRFGRTFPAATWFWRPLWSRRALRLYLWGLAIIVLSGVALRVEAALFEMRALSLVSALSSLQVGTSSKAEALSRIPSLRSDGTGPYGAPRCGADECVSAGIPNSSLSDALFLRVARMGNRPLYSVLSWWGFRFWVLSVYLNFSSGKVSYLSYHLVVSSPHLGDAGVGVVVVEVQSREHITESNPSLSAAAGPGYRLSTSRKQPAQSVGIDLTPAVRRELVSQAFDLKLRCLWSLAGCRTWNQLVPAAEGLSR
jgi:hypothetical protein